MVEHARPSWYDSSLPDGKCPLTGLSLAEVRALRGQPAEAVAQKYSFYVSKIKDSMPAGVICCEEFPLCSCQHSTSASKSNDEPLPECPQTIKDFLFENGCMCFENAVHNPTAIQKLLAANIASEDDDEHAAAAKQQRWTAVTKAMKLTPEQRKAIKPHRQRFESRLFDITAERRRILSSLAKEEIPETISGFQSATLSWLRINESSSELHANLQEEHVACMEMLRNAFGMVLLPMQKAIALIGSHPAFPDIYAIAKAAEAEENLLDA